MKNGYIEVPGSRKIIIVPESVIRVMNLQQGDILRAEHDGYLNNGHGNTTSQLLERLGAKVLLESGFRHGRNLRSKLKQADAVAVIWNMMS